MFQSTHALFQLLVASQAFQSPHTLIKGNVVALDDFPEVVYIRNDEGAHCTGTIVGPNALLTAAHCISKSGNIESVVTTDKSFKALCNIPFSYMKDDPSLDLALCERVGRGRFKVQPATIRHEPVDKGKSILLSGYGCTKSPGEGGNDGKLRIGFSHVVNEPILNNWFVTSGGAALCFGDSGGPAYFIAEHGEDETVHEVLGVNSRGDIRQVSYIAATYTKNAMRFINQWAKKTAQKICGVNLDCADNGWKQ